MRQDAVQRESLVIKSATSHPREMGCNSAFATKFFILWDDGQLFIADITEG